MCVRASVHACARACGLQVHARARVASRACVWLCVRTHARVDMQQLFIVAVALFGKQQPPLLQFTFMLLPLACYSLAVFATRPFQQDEADLLECGAQSVLLLLCLGGLLRTSRDTAEASTFGKDLGTSLVYSTLVLAALLIAWAVIKDLSHSIGSQETLRKLKLPLLSWFDKGLNAALLLRFTSRATEPEIRNYLHVRGAVSEARTRRSSLSFWKELKRVSREGQLESESSAQQEETDKVSFEMECIMRFIRSIAAVRMLRVIATICKEEAYVKISTRVHPSFSTSAPIYLCMNACMHKCMHA